jgi:hypothetical protein
MGDRLDLLAGMMKSAVGRLIGSTRLELDGQAGLALARSRRTGKRVGRPDVGRFREAVGRMTRAEWVNGQATNGRPPHNAERSGHPPDVPPPAR